jgi:hypothetical protein
VVDGRAGLIHAVMAVLGLVMVCGDLIVKPGRWRQAFKPQKLPWQHTAVSSTIIFVVVFVGLTYGP